MLLAAFSLCYPLDEPKSPEEPETPSVEIPSISNVIAGEPQEGKEYLFMMKADIAFSDGSTMEGMLYLTDMIRLTVSNYPGGGAVKPRRLTLLDISRIDIKKWRPVDKGDGNYFFMPSSYWIYTNGSEAENFNFNGNIALLNSFDFGDGKSTNSLSSCFYDSWIEGKKEGFHWENTKATMFNYDFEHPVDGIVVSLRLDNRYSWRDYR
jgi:hypothetical protein